MEYEFFDRELSWIAFNRRVLSEAQNPEVPLLERLKFLAITASNFDEFFMVRVASLRRSVKAGDRKTGPGPYTPAQSLRLVCAQYKSFLLDQYQLLNHVLLPGLRERGLKILGPEEWNPEQKRHCDELFNRELFSVLAPVKVEANRPFPFTGNLRLNLAFLIFPDTQGEVSHEDFRIIMLEIPPYLGRFVPLPSAPGTTELALIEDVISTYVHRLFPGYQIQQSLSFRITRDADIPLEEEKEEDYVEAMEKILQNRLHSNRVRFEVSEDRYELKRRLMEALDIESDVVFDIPGPLNLKDFMSLAGTDGFETEKYPVWDSYRSIPDKEDIWELIKEEDQILFHPYESFKPVVRLLTEAAVDPNVLSIRMTLYRTSGQSPIVHALAKAAQEGKQVIVLVELKARFDEEQNLGWAQTLERVGGIVIYGVEGLKVHSKALMIVRREPEGIRRYAHLGTGNYHDRTAKLYTDLGMLTARPEITQEVAHFFNSITGYSAVNFMGHLVMAPHHLKHKLLALIEGMTRQAAMGIPTQIIAKMNSLADGDVIRALYRASEAGVVIRLNVRGICMLVPGREFSQNITVVSIVDRYLEHSRIFYFRSGDREDVYLASADWMYRNLERRVELMFPILQSNIKERVIGILKSCFQDNVKSHVLGPDGLYTRRQPKEGEAPFRMQEYFQTEAMKNRTRREEEDRKEIKIRKKVSE